MIIREAVETDIPRLLPGLERLFEKTYHSNYAYCEISVIKTLLAGIRSDDICTFVADDYSGFIALSVHALPCNERILVAKDIVFFGESFGVGEFLMRAGAQWAQEKGCVELHLGVGDMNCGPALTRLYRKWGLTPVEAVFARSL